MHVDASNFLFFVCGECGCQHVGVTKNTFFYVGEVCTEHADVQLFFCHTNMLTLRHQV